MGVCSLVEIHISILNFMKSFHTSPYSYRYIYVIFRFWNHLMCLPSTNYVVNLQIIRFFMSKYRIFYKIKVFHSLFSYLYTYRFRIVNEQKFLYLFRSRLLYVSPFVFLSLCCQGLFSASHFYSYHHLRLLE